MDSETIRKLDVLARIEETLAEVLRDNVERAQSDDVRAHMVRLASSHQWHAQALVGMEGIEATQSEWMDREMDNLRRRVEAARDYGDFMDTLSNVEREESTRIEELLGDPLDEQIEHMLAAAKRDIDIDANIFLKQAEALGHA
ncbi:MAG TPA: hypothetical protein VLA05_05770 [Coriobacteriia bacterium]|nr:hypothetical protein [Coriobacteriia bacterium]